MSIHVQGARSFSGGQTSVEVQKEWVRIAPLETAAQSGLQEEKSSLRLLADKDIRTSISVLVQSLVHYYISSLIPSFACTLTCAVASRLRALTVRPPFMITDKYAAERSRVLLLCSTDLLGLCKLSKTAFVCSTEVPRRGEVSGEAISRLLASVRRPANRRPVLRKVRKGSRIQNHGSDHFLVT